MKFVVIFLILALLWPALRLLVSWRSIRPEYLKGVPVSLIPCESKPNCVCSNNQQDQSKIAEIQVKETPEASIKRLQELLEQDPSAIIIKITDTYIHAEFRTRMMAYIDDLQLLLSEDKLSFQIRSASRLGRSDFGVNRSRVEALREKYQAD